MLVVQIQSWRMLNFEVECQQKEICTECQLITQRVEKVTLKSKVGGLNITMAKNYFCISVARNEKKII